MRTSALGFALATMFLIAPAYGDLDFAEGNNPQPGEQNVLFLTDRLGNTVTGQTNISDNLINFTSTDELTAKGGQSDIDPVTGLIHNLTISVFGSLTFGDLIINPFKPADNGDLVVFVSLSDGNSGMFTYGNSSGNNFLTITTPGGEKINKVTIDSIGGFEGLKQPRISGIAGVVPVPEPGTPLLLLLLGSGALGLSQVLRRKMASGQDPV